MSVKSRNLPTYITFGDKIRISNKKVTKIGKTLMNTGAQYTESISHPFDRSTGHWKGGGPFYTSSYKVVYHTASVSEATNGFSNYSGPVYCLPPTSAELQALGAPVNPTFGSSNDSEMVDQGATAIARCAPSNPASNLGQALVETRRDGLPSLQGASLWKDRALRAKQAGDEYLNQQFGWTPLVNDVRSSARVAGQSGLEAERYQHRVGNETRRTYEFPSATGHDDTIDGIDGGGARFPSVSTGWWSGNQPERTVSRIETTLRWFVGVFVHPPIPGDTSWKKHIEHGQKARELYGLQLDPELLWEVAPWSWAVDWFSNVGDVISNVTTLSNFGGQVMRYGYMMEETIDNVTATIKKGLLHTKKDPIDCSCSSSRIITTKRRAEANPFGFGLEWNGLSPFQLSIAAALGISRFL